MYASTHKNLVGSSSTEIQNIPKVAIVFKYSENVMHCLSAYPTCTLDEISTGKNYIENIFSLDLPHFVWLSLPAF